MKRMSDISQKRINNIVDTDIIEDYSNIPENISVYEISGPLFFASARRYSEVIEEIGIKSKVLIIRMRHVSFIDQTGLHNLNETLKTLHNKGISVILSGINQEVLKNIEKSSFSNAIGNAIIVNTFDDAMLKAKSELTKQYKIEDKIKH
jgi:SulP family sulfate permease